MEQNESNVWFIFALVILFAAFIIFAFWLVRWQFNRADRLLENWASENEYRILEKRDANFGDGPTGTRQSSSQVKYRIVVADGNNQRRSGLAVVGSKSAGTLSDEVTVNWDE